MNTLNANTKGIVLIPTNNKSYPFVIKSEDDCYLLVKKDGTLTGDGFTSKDVERYYDVIVPSMYNSIELTNEQILNTI
jgi:hypothetical protein